MLTGAGGQVSWEARYAQFDCASVISQGPTFNLRFPGQYFDAETGLHYNWHRYYDPAIGRYITSDPIGLAGGLNTYGYANLNPSVYTDPEGLAAETVWDIFNVGVGLHQTWSDLRKGNYWDAAVSAGATCLDTVAAVVPVAPAGASSALKASRELGDVAREISVSRVKYGEAAEHIADAQKAGYPEVLTIARDGAPENRKGSIGGLPKVLGKQLDEYPLAMFKEGGRGASVRPISPRDNMAAGACIGNGCRGLRNGEKVRIKWWIDGEDSRRVARFVFAVVYFLQLP